MSRELHVKTGQGYEEGSVADAFRWNPHPDADWYQVDFLDGRTIFFPLRDVYAVKLGPIVDDGPEVAPSAEPQERAGR